MISFPQAPANGIADNNTIKDLIRIINNIMRGKTNNRGETTLTANSATTAILDENVGGESIIILMPLTANAATEIANGTIYVSSQGKKTFTLTHADNAQTNRNFRYAVIG